MKDYRTAQERLWATDFGDEYISRNIDSSIISSNINLFSSILEKTQNAGSFLELGANIGLNLRAIRQLKPKSEISAVEINDKAAELLSTISGINIFCESILDFVPEQTWDFVFTKGVLIHINPDMLPCVYDIMYRASRRYICVCEYYNPSPVALDYRGHHEVLFKRDFAGELLNRFSDLKLTDYGFRYRKDPNFPQDDLTWFLMEKTV